MVKLSILCCLFSLFSQEIFGKTAKQGRLTVWDPNYCNETKLQEEAQLTKTALGQFLGYHCDAVFYHCRWGIDGWRTYKKACRKGLVYDTTGTQNCNYDFNVEGCGMKQCADCLDDQFACCLSEECVELGQRCDGKYDCLLEEDEQNCPSCTRDQFPCVKSEQCIPIENRCNGIKECKDGTDEINCEECPMDHFFCRNTRKCIPSELRCNGQKDCALGEDEAFCKFTEDREYLCRDQQNVIAMSLVCNGVPDCPDETDEQYCSSDYNGNPVGGGQVIYPDEKEEILNSGVKPPAPQRPKPKSSSTAAQEYFYEYEETSADDFN